MMGLVSLYEETDTREPTLYPSVHHVRTQQEDRDLQPRKRALTRNQLFWLSDLALVVSRIVISVYYLSHSVYGIWLWQPEPTKKNMLRNPSAKKSIDLY